MSGLAGNPSELERVEAWQLQQLLEAGYSLDQAGQLQLSAASVWREAVRLVGLGCSPELALKILL